MAATKNYYSFLDEDLTPKKSTLTPKKEKFPSLASVTFSKNAKPKLSLPEFSFDSPVNYRTKACIHGSKCYRPLQCPYYHSEAERRIAIYKDGVWVNSEYSREKEQAKEEFRARREQRNLELLESGKWKTIECNREDDHFLEDCPYFHEKANDYNADGPKLQSLKRQENFLVSQLKQGKTLRWG